MLLSFLRNLNLWFWVVMGCYLMAATLILEGCQQNQALSHQKKIPEQVDFNFHIKPILSDRCFACHGPDANSREANLRFDTQEGAFAALEGGGHAIVPGQVDQSELVKRIASNDPKYRMPPPESNLTISDHEQELIKKWIEQGAEWKEHWSFNPLDAQAIPDVQNQEWVKNPIDQFVLAQLESENLEPSPQANKETLIRRLTLDLTGIPPTLEEIDSFLEDQSPDAYEKVIDRLLDSEAYAERMAMEWLDVARYADSHGYQDDLERTMWPWRDWVIKAFYENMPYDQFVQWQIAGDLMENPSYDQVLATAFNRNHMMTQEGGVIDEEYRVEYVADRTNTTGKALLGLTLECARCHDHKYDPISQKDYYQLFAFYNSVPEKGQVDYGGVPTPTLKLPEEEIHQIKKFIDEQAGEQEKILLAREKEFRSKPEEVEQKISRHTNPDHSQPPRRLLYYYSMDQPGVALAGEAKANTQGRMIGNAAVVPGKYSGAREFNGKNYADLGNSYSPERVEAFSYGAWVYASNASQGGAILAKMEPGVQGRGYKGMDLFMDADKISVHLIHHWPFEAIKVTTLQPLPLLQWTHVAMTYDGSSRAIGVKIYFNGTEQALKVEADNLTKSIKNQQSWKVGLRNDQGGFAEGRIDEVFIANSTLNAEEVNQIYRFDPMARILAIAAAKRTSPQKTSLLFHYLFHHDRAYAFAQQKMRALREREDVLNDPSREVMVMKDTDAPREAFVLERGRYDVHGKKVWPATPKVIMEFPENYPKNRLGLAQWLTHPKNPLTSRVAVNRYWQMYFGRGIVSTADDFGSQGSLPTHPELLDWLALEFINSGWDIKALQKLIVMSATYRQSSRVDPGLQAVDPENLLLARGPRFRLPAETIRDQALAISGLLVNKIGGPSVKPYQPEGLWAEKTSGGGFTRYVQGHGEDLYRRSMYTFWKRTVPPPSMMTFDASERNLCTVKRQATNTPLQALVLLNDPQLVEAARVLAERMMREGGNNLADRIQFAFRLATSRYATREEMEVLKEIYHREISSYKEDPDDAEQLLNVGEHAKDHLLPQEEMAALSIVASTIFNLSETITKG